MHEVQVPGHRPDRYVSPISLDGVFDALAEDDGAQVIAGGTDLMVELDRRVSTPKTLVDLTRIDGLDGIHEAKGRIHLGPLVTHNQAATDPVVIAGGLPLAQACLEVGSPALRNRATVVGNVVTASPANDTISALRALDADVSIASRSGVRTIPLSEFHLGVRRTALLPGELVVGLSFASIEATGQGVFVKLGLRRAQAISVVHGAIVLRAGDDGSIARARIALGSVAPTIVNLSEAEDLLVASGAAVNELADSLIDDVASRCRAGVTPIDDLRSTAGYRSDGVEIIVRRALQSLRSATERESFPSRPPTLGGPTVGGSQLPSATAVDLIIGDTIEATVNGNSASGPNSGGSLLDWLRDDLGLPGTKEGCAEGECGACTVHLDGTAVLSCLLPAARAAGTSIVTIEGLARTADSDELHPLQQAFIEHGAVQCGYCIPGFLMAAAKLDPASSDDERKLGLSGNLCRCTGYYAIEQAVGE